MHTAATSVFMPASESAAISEEPTAVAAAPPRALTPFQRLTMLFTNLPTPLAHLSDATLAATGGMTNFASLALRSRSGANTAAAAGGPPPEQDPRKSSAHVDAAAAATAAMAIAHLTPNFLVFLRDTPLDSSLGLHGPITPQRILEHTAQHGIDWQQDGSVSARHIMVVNAAPGWSFTRMAGFPCHTAFYLIFPRHETRSPMRAQYIDQFTEHVAGQHKQSDANKLSNWGWRLMRYPSQLVLSTASRGTTSSNAREKWLTARSIIIAARAAGLPGWDIIEEHMVVSVKTSGGWLRGPKPTTQFTIRVPPHPRFLAAVADISRTSAQLKTRLGWTAEYAKQPNCMQDVPVLPTAASAREAAKAQQTPAVTPPVTEAAPATATPTPATSLLTNVLPSVASPRPPSRFYFYHIDEHGSVFLEDDTTKTTAVQPLRDARTLNVLYAQMRAAQTTVQERARTDANLAALPVAIPLASCLADEAARSQVFGTLPLARIPATYPFLSPCAGEWNFIRCAVVPHVFRSLAVDPRPNAPWLLTYAGNLTHTFQPDQLVVDSTGRLFHPMPTPLKLPTPNAAADVTDDAPAATPELGLITSAVAQELVLREEEFTREEVEYAIQQQEETRRLTIEVHEEFLRRMESSPSVLGRTTADAWIRSRVQQQMAQLGLERVRSKYVIVWQGQAHRIHVVDRVG